MDATTVIWVRSSWENQGSEMLQKTLFRRDVCHSTLGAPYGEVNKVKNVIFIEGGLEELTV